MTVSRSFALLLLLAIAGCDRTDPYLRQDVWRPKGTNDANLRAMVVVPSDLVFATPAAPSDGSLAAAALTRLRRDNARPLLDSGLAGIMPVSGGSPPAVAPPSGNSQ